MKKILIIGGNGFIGRNLARNFLSHNDEVYSFDIQKPDELIEGVHYLTGDFFDDTTLEEVVDGMDVIIHALSTINPGNSNVRYMQGYSRDFVQTVRLIELCIEKEIKMIFLSSGGTVYGIHDKQPIEENDFTAPINHYGTVKLCIENVIRTFNTQQHTKMLIARISNPFGPGQDFRKGVGFVDAVLKKSIDGETIEIWGDGSVVRDYIYIDDVCEMIYTLINYSGPEDVFNISSNEGVSLNQILKYVHEIGLNPNVVYKKSRAVDVPQVVLDNERIMSIHPMNILTFKEGLKKYYEYLNQHYHK